MKLQLQDKSHVLLLKLLLRPVTGVDQSAKTIHQSTSSDDAAVFKAI